MTTENPQDSTDSGGRLALGLVGWRHASWRGAYYPEDLLEDWQLGYYANDMGCVLLDLGALQALSAGDLAEAIEDLPAAFRFYLRVDAGAVPDPERLALLAPWLKGTLGDVSTAQGGAWVPAAADPAAWCDDAGEARLLLLRLDSLDLRALRTRLAGMAPTVEAVVFESGSLTPADLQDVRMLTELLGIA